MIPVKIWNQDDFRIYLWSKFGIKLEDYINTKWNNDIVIFSNNVLKNSQSDVDGDHSCVYSGAGLDFQKSLREYHNEHITESQRRWIQSYIDGEAESNDDLIVKGVLVQHTYQLFDVNIHSMQVTRKQVKDGFSTFLYRAITAKANIGVSTNDTWIFSMILSLYQAYYKANNGYYQVAENTEPKPMYKLSDEQLDEISFTYVKALQDLVVRGVKHTDGGSSDFEILFLRNFHKPENNKKVFQLLTNDLELPMMLATKMNFIITWAEDMGFLSACGQFLKLYNKGTAIPEDSLENYEKLEDFIQSNTYFGMLLKPLYDLRKHAKEFDVNFKQQLKLNPKEVYDPFSSLNF